LISVQGVYPVEPKHLDTVGSMGKDIAHTVQGMELLKEGFAAKYAAAKMAKPNAGGIRVGRLRLTGTDRNIDAAIDAALEKTGFKIVPLSDSLRIKWDRATADGNTIAASGAWIANNRLQFALGVTARTQSVLRLGQVDYAAAYRAAVSRQKAWKRTLANVFDDVDFIAVPTLQTTPPAIPFVNLKIGVLEALVLQMQNTVPVNFAGSPALAIPVPLHVGRVPVTSLQLVGPLLSEAQLLNAGRLVEEAVKR
jgi:Asp-tRNA(Asn)/Glu-tRNA(Gln) amidotransferase A subunit family amidase